MAPEFENFFCGSAFEIVTLDEANAIDPPPSFALASLPSTLKNAQSSRVRAYWAGRTAAYRALIRLGQVTTRPLPRRATGEPLWPAGYAGSITHSGEKAAALVLVSKGNLLVGIDNERTLAADRAQKLKSKFGRPEELDCLLHSFDEPLASTLLFSAKESIFKSVFPLVQRTFGFFDYRLEALDLGAKRLTFSYSGPATSAKFPPLMSLHFQCDEQEVWTGLVWEVDGSLSAPIDFAD